LDCSHFDWVAGFAKARLLSLFARKHQKQQGHQ